ncbi:MAG TPA: hypothetical protein VEC99_18220 [Clostridia bacterium]|nr:hypothetical protein [Clostridia bacterium]
MGIRVGELVPGGQIQHALKVMLWGKLAFYFSRDEADMKPGYRWPAFHADGYANTNSYAGENPELQVGSLLCLRPDFDVQACPLNRPASSPEPCKIMALT